MKKRILAIFLTASLLVGAMAAGASAFTLANVYGNGTTANEPLITTSFTADDDNAEKTASGTTSVSQFSTVTMTITTLSASTVTITKTSGSSSTITPLSVSTTGEDVKGTFTITGDSAGTDVYKISVPTQTRNNGGSASAVLTLTVNVTAAPKPAFTAQASKLDIGALWDSTNKGFYAGQEVTSADFSADVGANDSVKWFEATLSNYTNAAGTSLTGSISPTTSGLTFQSVKVSGDQILHGYLTGTVKDVSSTQTYTLTVKATDVAGTVESTYTFKVMPKPTITTTTPSDIEWGKSWSFKPTATNANNGWEIVVSEDGSYLDLNTYIRSQDKLLSSADISFTPTNGQLSGTWKADRTKDGGLVGLSDWTSGTVATKKIILRAFNGTGDKRASTSKEYTLKFIGVDPKITQTNSNAFTGVTFTYGTNKPTSADAFATITAEGPGAISWDVTFPAGSGLSYDFESPANSYTSTLKIFGSPDLTMNKQTVTIKAYNPYSTTGTTITPALTIGSSTFDLKISGDTAMLTDTDAENALPSGDKVVGGSFGTINLVALPGPVTWDTTNLPAGVTLTVDTTDEYGRKATLTGDFSAARSALTHAAKNYLIKATNSVISKTDSISQDVMVYAEPVFDSEFLFNKKNAIDTDTELEYTVPVSNFPTMTSWDISINGTKIFENSRPTTDYTSGWQPNVNSTYDSNITKTSYLSIDMAALSKDTPVLKLIGSLDVVPTDGGKFTILITAKNPANTTGVTKEYTVTVNGTAPALKKEDITLSSSSASKAIAVTEGDAPIAMKAYIDAKTAKKLFGIEEDIDLSTANVSGIVFTQTTTGTDAYTGKGTFAYGTNETYLPSTVNYGSVAYNKLPITVEAENTDVSSKAASAKYTITISGTKPSWSTSNDLRGYNNTDLRAGATLGTAEELTTSANQALSSDSEYVLFKPAGSGPYDITVKPESKNGLSASVNDKGYVIITGTPTATKKDVSTKFSMTLKNPSTGDTAKTDLTVVAKPKPEAAGNIEKQLIIGKALKLAPKATVSNIGMKWVIDTVTQGSNAFTEDALKDTYGIDFDENKGTLSGTTKAATGRDNPLIVTMHASSDVAVSDTITATVTILGAKPKITAKKFSVAKDGSSTANITTNLSNETDTAKANITFSGTFDDALAGLSGAVNAPNTWQVTGTPAAVTKKQTVEVTMNNYGTETKGKVSFTVVGSKPTVTGDTSVTVNAGESATASLTLSDTSVVSQKIKWKIATKPKGVSAKVKGDVNGATVTVKAGKKVANNTTATFTVTATDSVSKTTSDPYTITVTVVNTNDTSAKAPETKAAAPEAEATEEIALGEGEVKLGVERTAGSLTAAQRRLIAEEGYVIAAVLPEIEEVTADGQYDFEVDIDEEVATGAELVWFAFSSKPTTDDEIVDFYDENYNDIFGVVPESHKVIVSPWLNAGTKYAPVIAVKADAAHAEATTLEGVKEAAEAKTE